MNISNTCFDRLEGVRLMFSMTLMFMAHVSTPVALPTGCERNLALDDGHVVYQTLLKNHRRAYSNVDGVVAWYNCNSGYLREGVSKTLCKYYENGANWQGEAPLCETRTNNTYLAVAYDDSITIS